ncbi:MAG: alpha/beta hydrolase, partial [Pseudomonadota bacterium]
KQHRHQGTCRVADHVHRLGHSTGALVAMLLASRHPSRVSRLALVGGFADGTFAGQQTWVREQVLNAPLGASMLGLAVKAWTANAYTFRAGMKEMVSDWRATENCPDFAAICERVRVDLRQANPHGLHRVVRWLSSCRAWDRLSAIVTPTTVIAGAQDRVVPFDHQRHVAARTRGRLRVHRHSGHLPMVDQTRWFAHTIDQWARN